MLYLAETVPNHFQENIVFLCTKRHIGQKQLAKNICLSYPTFVKYRRHPGYMPVYVMENLMNYFNCSYSDLMNEHEFTNEKVG
jgi:hypothetical protein